MLRAADFFLRQPAEPGPDVLRVLIAQFVEDGEGLPPCGTGPVPLSGAAVRIAQASQDGCLLRPVHQDFVRTARAKGLSRRQVFVRHVLRNSLMPIITMFGLDFAALLGGAALVTETVFNLPGVGQYEANAIGNLDVPPILVGAMFTAFFVVLFSAISDIAYAFLDPRIRLAG